MGRLGLFFSGNQGPRGLMEGFPYKLSLGTSRYPTQDAIVTTRNIPSSVGNPELNLHLSDCYWVGGRPKLSDSKNLKQGQILGDIPFLSFSCRSCVDIFFMCVLLDEITVLRNE